MLAKFLNPLVWRTPGRSAKKMHSFAHAEAGSVLDLRIAARATADPARAALYLRHSNDEARHTDLFASRSEELVTEAGGPTIGSIRADCEGLFEVLGEKLFLAFVHRGEARAIRQFECYETYFRQRGNEQDARLFAGILSDERRHASYTRALLDTVCDNQADAKRALRRVARWEAWRNWRRAGRALSSRLFAAAMIATYVAVLPIALIVKLAKRPRRGWQER